MCYSRGTTNWVTCLETPGAANNSTGSWKRFGPLMNILMGLGFVTTVVPLGVPMNALYRSGTQACEYPNVAPNALTLYCLMRVDATVECAFSVVGTVPNQRVENHKSFTFPISFEKKERNV